MVEGKGRGSANVGAGAAHCRALQITTPVSDGRHGGEDARVCTCRTSMLESGPGGGAVLTAKPAEVGQGEEIEAGKQQQEKRKQRREEHPLSRLFLRENDDGDDDDEGGENH